MKLVALLLILAACPKSADQKKPIEPGSNGSAQQLLPNDASTTAATLPPAAPLPEVPFGLPPVPAGALDGVTPELVAMGSALFQDTRLSASGTVSCATCHDPKNHFAGVSSRDRSRDGIVDTLLPPQLANLAWNPAAIAKLPAHATKYLGQDFAAASAKLATPYAAHIARAGGDIGKAIAAFTITRYDGNSAWDRAERTAKATDPLALGYKLFTAKGCANCHTPPLYTDLRVHDIGFQTKSVTRGLRGVGYRKNYFLADSGHELWDVLQYYMQDHSGDELKKALVLPKPDQALLIDFLSALDGTGPDPILVPVP